MTEEIGQQVRSAAKSAEATASRLVQFIDRARDGVEQVALDGTVAQLLGVQLRRVWRQPLELVVRWMPGYEGQHRLRAMGVQPVPDDDQRSADPPPKVPQRDNDLLAVDAAPEVASIQPGASFGA